jgi:hypothetical protein
VLSWAALASIPLSGQVHLALGAIPFFVLYALLPDDRARVLSRPRRGGRRGARRRPDPADRDRRLDRRGGRSLDEVRVYSATGLDFLSRHAGTASRPSSSSAG